MEATTKNSSRTVKRWVPLAASVHCHLAVVKMCPICLWLPPNALLSFSTIHKGWMPKTGITSAALLLLVSLACGECWAQLMSVLFTNLLTICPRSLLHKAWAKPVSMGQSWANFFSDCMGMGFPFRLEQEIASLVPNTQCAAENKVSVYEGGTSQCVQALLCRLEGNCLGFGSGKWDPASSQTTCLCLSETEEHQNTIYPELQGALLVLVKNQESLMSAGISERRIKFLICWIMGSICGRQGSCLDLSEGHFDAVICVQIKMRNMGSFREMTPVWQPDAICKWLYHHTATQLRKSCREKTSVTGSSTSCYT